MKLYPMKRMLVCTDLTEESDIVLKAAQEFCNRNQGSIDLLYVSEIGFHLSDVIKNQKDITFKEAFLGELKQSHESKVRDQLSRTGLSCRVIVRDGKVGNVILAMAEEGNHDLIIMGHGQSSVLQKLLGGNASKVISASPIPCMVIKRPPAFKKVAGLVDESREMDRIVIGTLDYLRNFRYETGAFISLWMDFPEPFGNSSEGYKVKDRLIEKVQHFSGPDDKTIVKVAPTRELKLADPIERILQEDHIETVILKRFSEGNLKRIYIGSTTRRLLEIFNGNILVIPP